MGVAVRPSLLAVVLVVGMMVETETRTLGPVGPGAELFVTSSISLHRPLFGDTVGPFTAGTELALTCSTQAPSSTLLTWWEGGTQLSAVLHEGGGVTSATLTLGALRLQDEGRRLTCREGGTGNSKTIKLQVQDQQEKSEILNVLVDGVYLENQDSINVKTGEDLSLNCVNQGYHPHAVSWWEGSAEQQSVATQSTYATSSVLSVKALTVDDSRRTFTCRSLNGKLSKAVTLSVIVAEEDITLEAKDYKLLFFCSFAVVVSVLVIAVIADRLLKTRSQTKKSSGTRVTSKMAAGEKGSSNIPTGAVCGKMIGGQNNLSLLLNDEDFDDTPGKMIQSANAS